MMLNWITRVLSPIWFLVAGAFGALAIYAKGRQDLKNKIETKTLEDKIEKLENLRNVEISTSKSDALDRLRKHGDVRD